MSGAALLAFAAVAAVAIATPGPTVLLALANGSRFGLRRACYGMAGAVASDIVLVGAVALGLGALLAASEFWFGALKWAGVAYLTFLGVALLRSRGPAEPALRDAASGGGSRRSVFMRSFTVAVTNPKGYLFVSAFIPQFIDPASGQLPQYLAIGTVFCGLDFAIMFAYALAGSRAARMLREGGMLWLDRICGGALLALAGSLATYRRAAA